MPNQDIMHAELPSYSLDLLIESLFKMQLRSDYQLQTHTIKVDAVPREDRIASISRQLSTDGALSFYQLLDKSQGKIGVVVSLVAVLKLMKRQLVGVVNATIDGNNGINININFNVLQLLWLA